MKQSIFFSHPSLQSQRWRQAFPDAIVTDAPVAEVVVGSHSLCWVITNLPDWEMRVKHLVQLGATVIVLSLQDSRRELLTMLAAGGRGYGHALATSETLRAIEISVTNGGFWLGSHFLQDLIKGISSVQPMSTASPDHNISTDPANGAHPALDKLTTREREVCVLVANAHSNKEVARHLNVTERTVKAHLSAAFEKLAVRDRVQLTLLLNQREALAQQGAIAHSPKVQNGG